MTVPEKAVEAARRALLSEARRALGPRGDISSEGTRFMKLALEAAEKHIAAQVLRDRAEKYRGKAETLESSSALVETFRLSIATLRDLADELDRDADELEAGE